MVRGRYGSLTHLDVHEYPESPQDKAGGSLPEGRRYTNTHVVRGVQTSEVPLLSVSAQVPLDSGSRTGSRGSGGSEPLGPISQRGRPVGFKVPKDPKVIGKSD